MIQESQNKNMDADDIRRSIQSYFRNRLKFVDVFQKGISIYAYIEYVDFKSEPTAMRELSVKLPGVHIVLERELTDDLWMKTIDLMESDKAEVYVKDSTGAMQKITIVEYIMEYMRSNDFS